MSRHQIGSLLFGDNEYSDAQIPHDQREQSTHQAGLEYLLEQQTQHLYQNMKEANMSGHQGPGSDSFLPHQKSQRQYHAQQQCKIAFPQVTAPSVEFSHSEFNLSKWKSPIKVEETRRRDVEIERMGRLLIAKKQEQREVNEVLDSELSSMAKEMSIMAKEIAHKDALINGYQKKIQGLNAEIQRRVGEVAASKARELGWEKEFKKASQEKEELFDVIDKKDKYFEELRNELTQSLNHIKQQQATIKSLRHDNTMMRDQLDLLGLSQKLTSDLNLQRLQSQPPQLQRLPANKRSLTIYQQQQLRKQSSVRTLGQGDLLKQQTKLLERLQGEKQNTENELQRLREKLASCEEGFMAVKNEREGLWEKNEGLEKMVRQLQGEAVKREAEMCRERQSRDSRDSRENRESRELEKDKILEYEKRFKTQNEELRRKEDKVKELLIEITEKNKFLQESNRTISDLRGRLEIQTQKSEQATKQSRVLNTQLKDQREKIKSLERTLEDKSKTRKQQDRIEQLKKDVVRLQKQAQQRQMTTKDLRKKLQQATKKAVISRSRINELQQQLGQVKAQLAAQKEGNKKQNQQFAELKKRANEAEILANKLKILETRLATEMEKSQQLNCKETFDLSDRVEALEEILRHKEEELEELRDELENSGGDMHQLNELKMELQEKQTQLQNYRRQVEFREKSLQFLHNKLLKVQRQKLQIQAQAKIFQSNFCQVDSQLLTDGDLDNYSTKLTMRRDRNDFIELKLKALQQRNKVLEDKLRDQTRKSRTGELKDSSGKVEVLVLKNRVKELTDMLNKVYSEDNAKKLPPESLSPEETLEFLLDTMRRVNKSSEMIKLLNRSVEFVELLRNIEKKKEETMYTKRLYM